MRRQETYRNVLEEEREFSIYEHLAACCWVRSQRCEGDVIIPAYHTRNQHGRAQGRPDDSDEMTQCERVGDKLTNGTAISELSLTLC